MSVIMTLSLIVGAVIVLVSLLIITARALRRAERKIDQIIEEECRPGADANSLESSDDRPVRRSNFQE